LVLDFPGICSSGALLAELGSSGALLAELYGRQKAPGAPKVGFDGASSRTQGPPIKKGKAGIKFLS
jgi:hypothetical protein